MKRIDPFKRFDNDLYNDLYIDPAWLKTLKLKEDNELRTSTMPKPTLTYTPKVTDNAQLDLTKELKKRIIGQDHVLEQITSTFYKWEVGMTAPSTPAGTFLLLGPTGTGKTRSVEALAEVLLGNEKNFIKIDCAEFAHSHEIAKLLGCFVPGTRVLMANGERKPIEYVKAGDWVIIKDGSPGQVSKQHVYQNTKDLVRLAVSGSNIPIVVTPCHEILAISVESSTRIRNPKELYKATKLQWIPAKELKRNDIVAYPRYKSIHAPLTSIDLAGFTESCKNTTITKDRIVSKTPSGELSIIRHIPIDRDFMRLAGYYVSEGGSHHDGKQFNFTLGWPCDSKVHEDLVAILLNLFMVNPATTKHGKNGIRVRACSKTLTTMFQSLFGEHVSSKRVPAWFFDLPDYLLFEFLDAAFMGDGGKTVNRRLDYSTVSPTLHSQMELIIRSLGFTSQTSVQSPAKENWLPRYRLYVSGEQIDRFVGNLPFVSKLVTLNNSGNSGIQRMSFVDEDYVYFRITDTDMVPYDGPVYDLSVKQDQSYVVDIIVHNSPPGYLGHRETQPALTNETLARHYSDRYKCSILLFDEIEKASDALWNLLLGILDKATLTLGDNRKVDFSNTFIFMTSNLGAREMQAELLQAYGYSTHHYLLTPNQKKLDDIALQAAKKRFQPEFLNRIDEKLVYHTLTKESLSKILDQLLVALQERVHTSRGAHTFLLEVTQEVRDLLLEQGVSHAYGARELKRSIENNLTKPLVHLIRESKLKNPEIKVLLKRGAVDFQISTDKTER